MSSITNIFIDSKLEIVDLVQELQKIWEIELNFISKNNEIQFD